MTPLIDEDILRAAEILEREADGIKAAHTLRDRWVFPDEHHRQAHRDYTEMRRIARRLRRHVGTL